MSVALISAIAALVAGLVTAAVTGWLAGREKAAEDVRELRLDSYPPVWRRTSAISRWPQTNLTYADLERLHLDLRKWYFEVGGLFLSENARKRYGYVQRLVDALLSGDGHAPDDELAARAYDDLMETASAFRTALTEDLESRRQRSLWWTLSRARLHKRQTIEAERRLRAAALEGGDRRVRYELSAEDQVLEPSSPPEQGGAS
jgi:hypothetical protein